MDDMEDIARLEKLNQKEHKVSYRPSREPYRNTYVENIRQNNVEELNKKRRFRRTEQSKRTRKVSTNKAN